MGFLIVFACNCRCIACQMVWGNGTVFPKRILRKCCCLWFFLTWLCKNSERCRFRVITGPRLVWWGEVEEKIYSTILFKAVNFTKVHFWCVHWVSHLCFCVCVLGGSYLWIHQVLVLSFSHVIQIVYVKVQLSPFLFVGFKKRSPS